MCTFLLVATFAYGKKNSAYVQLALCVTSHIENLVSPLLTSKLRVR